MTKWKKALYVYYEYRVCWSPLLSLTLYCWNRLGSETSVISNTAHTGPWILKSIASDAQQAAVPMLCVCWCLILDTVWYLRRLWSYKTHLFTCLLSDSFQSPEEVFMEIRKPLEWHCKQMDHFVGLNFNSNFNFALVGHLLKGERAGKIPRAAAHSWSQLPI